MHETPLVEEALNFSQPLEVGLKLAITLGHLAAEETYKSLAFRMVGQTIICKFVPEVCRAILEGFQGEYLACSTSPGEWKESSSETDGMSPMLLVR